ncbi:MAG: DUF1659 domain-containing protein [Bacillota bacterium]
MPVDIIQGPSKFRIVFNHGVDGDGKVITKTKTYTNVKAVATDEDVYAVAEAIIGLQSKTAEHVMRTDDKEIVQA